MYSQNLSTRIDYINSGENKGKFVTNKKYEYYYDNEMSTSERFYIYDGTVSLKKYFLKQEIVEKYIKLVGAENQIQNISVNSDYVMILEPILAFRGITLNGSTCLSDGFFTASDVYYVRKAKPKIFIGETVYNGLNFSKIVDEFPTFMYLSNDENLEHGFANYNFNVGYSFAKMKEIYKDTNSNYPSTLAGFGFGIVYGYEVCLNCGRYRIVYRTINLENPFLYPDGKVRKLSENSNWYNHEKEIDSNIYKNPPLFTVTLSSTDIKRVRDYNKNNDYDFLKFYNNFSNIFSPCAYIENKLLK